MLLVQTKILQGHSGAFVHNTEMTRLESVTATLNVLF